MAPKRRKVTSSSRTSGEAELAPFEIVIDNTPKGKTNNNKRKNKNRQPVHEEKNPWDSKLSYHYSVNSINGNDANWEEVKKYTKFQVRRHWDPENPLTLENGDLVYVESDAKEIEHDGSAESRDDARFWIAKVLECRAISSAHVFLRVFWIYRPDDLPQGRRPYHGEYEVIPSNYMQIIDALTVDGKVDDLQYFDENDDEGSKSTRFEDKFWRQTFDIRTEKLSKVRHYCICNLPANPDVALIQCANTGCKKWMHQSCISRETVIRTYNEKIVAGKEEENSEEVMPEEDGDTITVAGIIKSSIKNALGLKHKSKTLDSRATSVEGEESGNGSAKEQVTAEDSHASKPTVSRSKGKGRGRPSKTKRTTAAGDEDAGDGDTIYTKAAKHFSAEIMIETDAGTQSGADSRNKLVEDDAVSVEITDLRKGQGKKTWREPIKCLWCSDEVS